MLAARQFDGSVMSARRMTAARGRGGGFDVFGVGADVADMGKREGDDLAGIGRVGHDFLIAGHRGVEADLADRN
jgi:hypothetical protein